MLGTVAAAGYWLLMRGLSEGDAGPGAAVAVAGGAPRPAAKPVPADAEV